ncbi:MAG: RNA-binding S4 domain-containing protein [Vampirovibrionales bacterium]
MRLDKYLKMARLIKRRTLANELCDLGGVCLNGRVAKASSTVREGDELELSFGNRLLRVRILGIPTRPAGNQAEAQQYVEVLHQERLSTLAIDEEAEA